MLGGDAVTGFEIAFWLAGGIALAMICILPVLLHLSRGERPAWWPWRRR